MTITPEEAFVINHIRQIGYGNLSVFVQNGVPIRIERTTESILVVKAINTVKPL